MKVKSILFAILGLTSCVTQKVSTTNQDQKYHEDLSSWRPKIENENGEEIQETENSKRVPVEVVPLFAKTKELNLVLDSMDRYNLKQNFIDGYTIQVFNGDREGAMAAKKELTISLPDVPSDLSFNAPTFRVKAGDYLTRIEAEQDYFRIKKIFPNAIVIPQKISIKNY